MLLIKSAKETHLSKPLRVITTLSTGEKAQLKPNMSLMISEAIKV
jgi:hypothetical protein